VLKKYEDIGRCREPPSDFRHSLSRIDQIDLTVAPKPHDSVKPWWNVAWGTEEWNFLDSKSHPPLLVSPFRDLIERRLYFVLGNK
jgi:hypothetical protein